MEIIRYINHVPIEGELSPTKIANPGLVKLFRDVQLKLFLEENPTSGKEIYPI